MSSTMKEMLSVFNVSCQPVKKEFFGPEFFLGKSVPVLVNCKRSVMADCLKIILEDEQKQGEKRVDAKAPHPPRSRYGVATMPE